MIVIIHEFGHITCAKIFEISIKKINIYPFGGYTIFNYYANKKIHQELLMALAGIIFQFLLYIILKNIINNNLYIYKIFSLYNKSIIYFNMIPIFSLDGGKVLNILLNSFIPYKLSNIISIYISFVIILLLIILNFKNINMVLICLVLLFLVLKEYKNRKYAFNLFLISRSLHGIRYKKNNIINGNNIDKFMKYLNNIFIINNNYIDECDFLKEKYKMYNCK